MIVDLSSDFTDSLRDFEERFYTLGGFFEPEALKRRLGELEEIMSSPDFWNDTERAKKIGREKTAVEDQLSWISGLEKDFEELTILTEMLDDGEKDAADEILKKLDNLEREIDKMETRRMLSGENDRNSAIVQINSGAGGTEAQDWAEMLFRMYSRWIESRDFELEVVDLLPGDEAGIKNITFLVEGDYAYGLLKAEVGVHRLIRISPFDTGKRRHTSFASVFVSPQVDDDIDIEINESDLRIDTFRASGAGGQHVNKTDSAVRITHLPTNIVVTCSNEKSQHRNKAIALKILKSRLYENRLEEERKKQEELHSQKKDISWGSQIRTYTMQPYRLVKDHRTGIEVGNVDAVLDGEIDKFIETYLLSSN
ncbi:MAG: peptide chain release factor 2 [Deltaproteobacteria bacterium]|uniref:Peptide chain release factor 2 n=1 Tax=Candidatus Zymogenus saltonus TaxID=2844893 RepID=A0A9D8KDI5_9DELT|nr:peptide chain release factor 2 [Candidatus Zymogenus saltonus]